MTAIQLADGRLLRPRPAGLPSPAPLAGFVKDSEGWWGPLDGSVDGDGRLLASFSEIYRRQPQIAGVVDKLARRIATLPLDAYRRTGDDKREVVRGDALDSLIRKPMPRAGAVHFLHSIAWSLLVHGNALAAKIRGPEPDAPPLNLWPLDWSMVGAYAQQGGPVEWWSTIQFGEERFIPVAETLHFAWTGPDGEIGVSPLEKLGVTIRHEDAMQRYQTASFRNGARLGGAITLPAGSNPSPEVMAETRRTIEDLHKGVDKGFKIGLLAPGAGWQPTAMTAVEAELLDQRRLNREEIGMVYDLAGPLMNDLTHGTYCLPADAMVSTDVGPVAISDVRTGDRVWSKTDTGLELKSVAWSGQTGTKPLLTIRTQNRTLRCTDNHPVLVARHLDRRRPENRGGPAYEHEWTPAGQLQVGDILMTVTSLPATGVRDCPSRDDVSIGFAEFCGLMLGDGTIDIKRGSVQVARGESARYMDHYRQVMTTEFAASDSSRGPATHPVALKEHRRSTRFVSRSAADELHALGISGTAHTKRLPQWVHQLEPDLRAGFLRGFVEADGSVDKQGRVAVHSANEILLREIRSLCIGLGVPVTNVRAQRGWVTLPDGKRIYSVMWSFLCSDPGVNTAIIGSHDPQDAQRMKAGKPWGAKTYSYRRRDGGEPPTPQHCGHARVVSIEEGEVSVPVYDITVPDTHNFVAEGVVVHNSNIEELNKGLYRDVLPPWLTLIEHTFQAQLLDTEPAWLDRFVSFDLGEKLRGEPVAMATALKTQVEAGLITRDEARRILNLPPAGGAAAELTMNVNNQAPLDEASGSEQAPAT